MQKLNYKILEPLTEKYAFYVIVCLPIFVTIIYLLLFASPRYQSQTQFIIKQNNSDSVGMSFAIPLLGNQPTTSLEDTYILKDYILSPNLLNLLQEELDLRKHYAEPSFDFFKSLGEDVSAEAFLKYYRNQVKVTIDLESSIVNLEVTAFSPRIAEVMTKIIIAESEAFINKISIQMAEAQVTFVEKQVERAEVQLRGARSEILQFQTQYHLLDPLSDSNTQFSIISRLEGALTEKEAELKTLKGYLRDHSQPIIKIKNEIRAIKEQLSEEATELAGEGGLSLNQILAKFDELRLGAELNLELFTSSLASLEKAQIDASKQIKFVVVISSSGLPEAPTYPKPLRDTLTVLVLLFLFYGVFKLVIATIKDHRT